MPKNDSQNDKILKHLLSGRRLTRYEAILMFRVQNLTARISELRQMGFNVKTIEKVDPNKQTYAEYFI